jgi:anti-anti-sigma regulatory factor
MCDLSRRLRCSGAEMFVANLSKTVEQFFELNTLLG